MEFSSTFPFLFLKWDMAVLMWKTSFLILSTGWLSVMTDNKPVALISWGRQGWIQLTLDFFWSQSQTRIQDPNPICIRVENVVIESHFQEGNSFRSEARMIFSRPFVTRQPLLSKDKLQWMHAWYSGLLTVQQLVGRKIESRRVLWTVSNKLQYV